MIKMNSTENKEEYKWELNKIVDSNMCAKCGTCVIACPNNIIEFKDKPQLKEECLRCGNGMCLEVCPRVASGKYQIAIREKLYEKFYYGKGTTEGQDGGVVTTFLTHLINTGKIDGAIVVGDEKWKPVSMIVQAPDDLSQTIKSKYTISTMDALTEAGKMGLKKVAVVGLPCQIAGLRKLQYFPYNAKHDEEIGWEGKKTKLPKIEYLIGLFCTEKFEFDTLQKILDENNIDIETVQKFDVSKGKFIITTETDTIELPVKDIPLASGCKMCRDFDSQMADISMGSVGSPDGYSTIVIRSEKGEEIKEIIDLQEGVNEKPIKYLRNLKMKRFNKNVEKRLENEEYLSYYWNSDYGGAGLRIDGDYFIRCRAKPSGFYTIEEAESVNEIAKKYNARIKLTNRGEYELHSIKPKDVESAIKDIREAGLENGTEGPLVRSVLACPGNENCSLGLINTTELCTKIEERFKETPAPYKFKIAISGCPNKCVRPQIQDFGINGFKIPETDEEKCNGCGRCADVCKVEALDIQGGLSHTNYNQCIGCGKCIKACPQEAKIIKEEGFTVFIGGKAGREVVEGLTLNVHSEEELFNLIDAVLKVYNKFGIKPQRERLANTMKRIGQIKFMNEVYKLC